MLADSLFVRGRLLSAEPDEFLYNPLQFFLYGKERHYNVDKRFRDSLQAIRPIHSLWGLDHPELVSKRLGFWFLRSSSGWLVFNPF